MFPTKAELQNYYDHTKSTDQTKEMNQEKHGSVPPMLRGKGWYELGLTTMSDFVVEAGELKPDSCNLSHGE